MILGIRDPSVSQSRRIQNVRHHTSTGYHGARSTWCRQDQIVLCSGFSCWRQFHVCRGNCILSFVLRKKEAYTIFQSSQIRSKVLGESERNIAKVFAQARANAPCILFIDQIDMLLSKRGDRSTSENTSDRIVTSFLTGKKQAPWMVERQKGKTEKRY